MGLDTSHGCWHGSYSSFSYFRDRIAHAAKERLDYVPDYNGHPARAYQGWWDDDHPWGNALDVFFIHSDCDGYIFPQDADDLADALETLVDAIDDDGSDWSDRTRLSEFIAGLRAAHDAGEIVVFH
jgi:hypothetical protein